MESVTGIQILDEAVGVSYFWKGMNQHAFPFLAIDELLGGHNSLALDVPPVLNVKSEVSVEIDFVSYPCPSYGGGVNTHTSTHTYISLA